MNCDSNGIIDIIKENANINVELLLERAVEKFGGNQRIVRNLIITMIDDGMISLQNPEKYYSFKNYLGDIDSLWFYMVVFSVILYNLITIASTIFKEIIFLRIIFGSLFSFFIPGYVFVKALYANIEIEIVEKVAISIGLSLILTPITGYILNYTPWGIDLKSLSVSLSLLSLIIALIAMYRHFIIMSNQAEI